VVNPVKRHMREGAPTMGTWIQIGHPAVAEILANIGFDWIAVDCEHTDITTSQLADLLRAMGGRDVVPLVRVRENQTLAIRQPLDIGAMGVIVPLVNTPEEAAAAVAAAKFPPQGIRGFSFVRSNMYGADFQRYATEANDQTIVVVMIESRLAVENIEAIMGTPGVDGALIGPYDLSGSYGVTGQTSHPVVLEAFATVARVCREQRKAAGIHVVVPDATNVQSALQQGFTFVALGMDDVFMESSARQTLRVARDSAGPQTSR
jgi:2-keto-3-deoxy-L-rhamnonate aldolase RhmA